MKQKKGMPCSKVKLSSIRSPKIKEKIESIPKLRPIFCSMDENHIDVLKFAKNSYVLPKISRFQRQIFHQSYLNKMSQRKSFGKNQSLIKTHKNNFLNQSKLKSSNSVSCSRFGEIKPKLDHFQNQQNEFKEKVQESNEMNPKILSLKNLTETISTKSSNKDIFPKMSLSDFQIGEKIGQGKYGQVYFSKHKKTGSVFALKKIYKKDLSEEIKNQLINEIKIQLFLDHPNIVKLYGFFSEGDYIYLLMQLITAGNIFESFDKVKFFPESCKKNIIKQLCQGKDYLNHHSIIHRDLKLENLLYHFGMIKICDFGWSAVANSARRTLCGTPLYLSPEILLHKHYDDKVDIWSIGIIAYEILVGKVPFQLQNKADYKKIIQDQVQLPFFLGQESKSFLKGCLEKNPNKRFSVDQLLQHPYLRRNEINSYADLY